MINNHQQILDDSVGFAVIYKITSPSEKSYVGQSVNFKERYSTYRRLKKNSIGNKIFNALNKYGGIENFEIELLCKIPLIDDLINLKKQLDSLEVFYIKYCDSFNCGYNSTIGGEGSLGRITKEETKQKISIANKGNNAVDDVICTCATCGKEFGVQPWSFNKRIKQTKTGKLFCSVKCTAKYNRKETSIITPCGYCSKDIIYPKWKYNTRMKNSTTGKLFCGTKCYRKYLKEKAT